MKIIEAKNLTDDQWKSVALMEEFLKTEIYPQFNDGEVFDPESVKNRVLNSLRITEISFADNYYFFKEDKAIAVLEAFERKETLYFMFDYFGREVPVDITEMIFEKVRCIMKERKYDQAKFHTFEERLYNPVLKTYVEIYEESVTSKLMKSDMDFEELEKIVAGNKAVKNFELKLFNCIPEDLYERYVEYINEIYEDANEFHPKKERPNKFTLSDLKARVEDMKIDNSLYYLYILFDGLNIAAFCAVFVDKIDGINMIEHRGGFTTAGRSYRGLGLAKFLKAKMYLKINEDYPDFEYILTDTFPWNRYMYRINEEFGFKPFKKGYTFRIKL